MTREDDEEYFRGLLQFTSDLAKKVLTSEFSYKTGFSNNKVYLKLQGPRLGTFLFALGGEVVEVLYEGDYHTYIVFGDSYDEIHEFMRDALADLARFITSDQPFIQDKTRILRKKCFRIHLAGYDLVLS